MIPNNTIRENLDVRDMYTDRILEDALLQSSLIKTNDESIELDKKASTLSNGQV